MEDKLTPEEELKAQNELLKLKLEIEHGMQGQSSKLGPEMENQWLNYIYEFENAYKNATKIKLYDFIGRPEYKKIELLQPEDVSKALNNLLDKMDEKGVGLDCLCEYEDQEIYRFITEELFEYEMDNISMPGGKTTFIYEEFHPNHEHDIRGHGSDFFNNLLSKPWDKYCEIYLADKIILNGLTYDKESIQKIILEFQEAHEKFDVEKNNVDSVDFVLDTENLEGKGTLQGSIRYFSTGANKWYEGPYTLAMVLEFDFWSISEIYLPGF